MIGASYTVMVRSACAVAPEWSVAWTVKLSVSAAGSTVPLMMPDAPSKVSPIGRVPEEIDHEIGDEPPAEARVWE